MPQNSGSASRCKGANRMKALTRELWMNVPQRRQIISIHDEVGNDSLVRESGVQEGLVLVNAMHITASVFINDNEPGCTATTTNGWKNWLRLIRRPNDITTTVRERTTRTRTTSVRSWVARSSSRLRTASCIWAVGAHLLLRVRWRREKDGARENHRRVAPE